MANTATQNAENQVGRNAGAGPGGVSETVPSRAEANRGFQPLSLDGSSRSGGLFARLGAATLVGAGVAAWITRRVRRPKSRVERVRGWIRSKR